MSADERYEFARMPLEMLRAQAAQLGVVEHATMGREELTHAIEAVAGGGATSSAVVKKPEPPKPLTEPDSIYIDRGLPLPDSYAGTRLWILVRDPGTIFVYWEADVETPDGWNLVALSADGTVLAEVPTAGGTAGSAYLLVEASRVASIGLRPVRGGVIEGSILELRVESLRPAASQDEHWVDVRTSEVVGEAPSEGRAPGAGVPTSFYVSR